MVLSFAVIVSSTKDCADSISTLMLGHRVRSIMGTKVAPSLWLEMERFVIIVAWAKNCARSTPILVTTMLCTITILHTSTTIMGTDTPFSIRFEISKLWNAIFQFHTYWLCCVSLITFFKLQTKRHFLFRLQMAPAPIGAHLQSIATHESTYVI